MSKMWGFAELSTEASMLTSIHSLLYRFVPQEGDIQSVVSSLPSIYPNALTSYGQFKIDTTTHLDRALPLLPPYESEAKISRIQDTYSSGDMI